MKDIGRSGGAKNIYEICQRLSGKYEVEICCLSADSNWYGKVNFRIINLGSPSHVIEYLKNQQAIKVATWWETADWVARSGGGYYLVQDIESSYYQDEQSKQNVLASYKLGLKCLTINNFQEMALKLVFGAEATRIDIAIDNEVFKPAKYKRENIVLYCHRNHFLKNPELFKKSVELLKKSKTIIYSYGVETCKFADYNFLNISDEQLAGLMNKASVFVSTSVHEGFGLPILEAMACGLPIVTTSSNGNLTFCINGVNCLIAENENEITDAVTKILNDEKLAKKLATNGLDTAANYRWDKVISKLEDIFIKNTKPRVTEINEVRPENTNIDITDIDPKNIFIKEIRENEIYVLTKDGKKYHFPKQLIF